MIVKGRDFVDNLIRYLKENTYDDMEKAAAEVLNKFKITEAPIPIVKIMKTLNFRVIAQDFGEHSTLSGIIAVDYKLKQNYDSDKVISININDNLGHQRFTMAHELCHYIFDFNRDTDENYYNAYDTQLAELPEETRANTFAANLLMPNKIFIKEYKKLTNLYLYDIIGRLAEKFLVSETAIKRRINELQLRESPTNE